MIGISDCFGTELALSHAGLQKSYYTVLPDASRGLLVPKSFVKSPYVNPTAIYIGMSPLKWLQPVQHIIVSSCTSASSNRLLNHFNLHQKKHRANHYDSLSSCKMHLLQKGCKTANAGLLKYCMRNDTWVTTQLVLCPMLNCWPPYQPGNHRCLGGRLYCTGCPHSGLNLLRVSGAERIQLLWELSGPSINHIPASSSCQTSLA